MKLIDIKKDEFDKIRKFVYSTIGINLTDQKINLVNERLQKLLRKYELNSFNAYFDLLQNDKTGSMLSELADNISTNHTFFWREHEHFEFFKEHFLPQLIKRKQEEGSNDISLWCAGCSTGEEPYTIIMQMKELLGDSYNNWKAGILATDISSRALEYAIKGEYPQDRLKLMPKNLMNRYFNKVSSETYVVDHSIKKEVVYRRFNLMNDKFPFKKKFDSIFCRNVMIYFDEETKEKLVTKFYNNIDDNGYLFIGHAESINKKKSGFTYIKTALYRK